MLNIASSTYGAQRRVRVQVCNVCVACLACTMLAHAGPHVHQ